MKKTLAAAAVVAALALGGCGTQGNVEETAPQEEHAMPATGAGADEGSAPVVTDEMQAYIDQRMWDKMGAVISVLQADTKLVKDLGYDGIVDGSAAEAMKSKALDAYHAVQPVIEYDEALVPDELKDAHTQLTYAIGGFGVATFDMAEAAQKAAGRDEAGYTSLLQQSLDEVERAVDSWNAFTREMKSATGMSDDELSSIGVGPDAIKAVTG